MEPAAVDSTMAFESFELKNDILKVDEGDELFKYDGAKHKAECAAARWIKDGHYFKKVKVSTVALLKMLTHASSGKKIEVMGLLQGTINGDTFIVLDCFALPAVGFETRVGLDEKSLIYSVEYAGLITQVGRLENVIGWYHSHPGLNVFMSRTDCETADMSQKAQDPFLSIVIDHLTTAAVGRIQLGAYRTWPANYVPTAEDKKYMKKGNTGIPQDAVAKYGNSVDKYYELEVMYFTSRLDQQTLPRLWNKYWVNTLSSSTLLANAAFSTGQMEELTNNLGDLQQKLGHYHAFPGFSSGGGGKDAAEEGPLAQCSNEATKLAIENLQGMAALIVKDMLFARCACSSLEPKH